MSTTIVLLPASWLMFSFFFIVCFNCASYFFFLSVWLLFYLFLRCFFLFVFYHSGEFFFSLLFFSFRCFVSCGPSFLFALRL